MRDSTQFWRALESLPCLFTCVTSILLSHARSRAAIKGTKIDRMALVELRMCSDSKVVFIVLRTIAVGPIGVGAIASVVGMLDGSGKPRGMLLYPPQPRLLLITNSYNFWKRTVSREPCECLMLLGVVVGRLLD